MKRFLYLSLFIVLLATSCKKDAELTVLKAVVFNQTAAATPTSIALTAKLDNNSVLTVTWEKATFPVAAPVSYSLQFDLPSDVNGATPWANAKEVAVGNDILTKSILGLDLNTLATDLGLATGVDGKIVVRVKATMDRSVYSNTIELSVNPYKPFVAYPAIWVAGDFQGWSPATAPTIVSVKSDNLYEGYINMPAGGTYQLKLAAQPDWTPTAYGTTNGTDIVVANFAGDNLTLPGAGYYELSVDLNKNTWVAYPCTWSILGDATPGGWTTDTQMTYDAANQVWKVTADMVSTGSFKFRANNDWKNDFGIDGDGKLAYADNQVFGYTSGINNITVPTSGNYTITLDLHIPGAYTYSLKKN